MSLLETHPELIDEWISCISHPGRTPNDVTKGVRIKVLWQCKKCHHQWEAMIYHRTGSKSGCPVCGGKAVGKKNCLLNYPKLLSEYNLEKNNHLPPNKIAKCSHSTLIWTCLKCGKDFKQKVYNRTKGEGCPYCRPRGERHHNWDSKLSTEDRNRRRSAKIIEWRNKIYKRDNYTCQICLALGHKLNAHHLNGFSLFHEQRYDVNNGVTLCVKCHRDFHSEFGISENTLEQYKKYKDMRYEEQTYTARPQG